MPGKSSTTRRRSRPGAWRAVVSENRSEILKLAILGVPLALLASLNELASQRILAQPWQAVVFLIPIAAVGVLVGRSVIRGGSLALDRATLLLLGAYVLFFSVAAETHVLDWSHQPTLFGQPGGRGWITPVSWGDWRYRLVPKVDGDELVIVLREPTAGKTREAARAELVTLLGLAATHDARGVAFDYYFDGESALDALLCAAVDQLGQKGVPVFFGYGFERFQGRLNALPVPRSLQACVTPARQGHLLGFLDADRRVRLLPLFFNDDRQRPALSLRVAQVLAESPVSLPDDGRLQFVEPSRPSLQVRLADLVDELPQHESSRNALQGRFVLVAEESDRDSFDTPAGRKPGVVVHAEAVQSMLHGHYLRDAPWWIRFWSMFAFCYGLAFYGVSGASIRQLALVCVAGTAVFVLTAVVALVAGLYRYDVVYPTAAVWLLLPLLVTLRRSRTRT